jgi:hypothetical protein
MPAAREPTSAPSVPVQQHLALPDHKGGGGKVAGYHEAINSGNRWRAAVTTEP